MASYTDRIRPNHSGITTYLEDLQKHKYQIPTFQREIVWEPDNVKKLWDSIYKFYPFGSILIWKTNLRLQHHRDDSAKGRLARAILALYANHNPKDWAKPHRSVLSDVYYVITDKPNLHHVFPTAFVEKSGISTRLMANSLMNIAYLTQITNLQISDKNPLEYLREYNCDGFQDVLNSHLIPGSVLQWSALENVPDDALEAFVEARVDLLVSQLRHQLGGIVFDLIDSKASI